MIFTKRNAIVGFVTLKALDRYRDKRRKKEKRTLRTIGIAALVVVSVAALAGIAAAAARKRRAATTALEAEPEAAGQDAEGDAATPGNGRVSPEPAPAA